MKIKRGSTSVRRLIFVADSSSTTGAGLANLTHASSGLSWYYFAGDLSADVQVTPVSATLGTYTSGGFVAVDNSGMPGWYEIGIPNAALDGGTEVAMQLRGVTNMAPVNIHIELDAVDYQSATNFGLSKFADIETDTQDLQTSMTNLTSNVSTVAANVIFILADTDNIQTRLPAALVDGKMDSTGGGGSGSDPLENAVPGSYAEGTAGYKLGLIGANASSVYAPSAKPTFSLKQSKTATRTFTTTTDYTGYTATLVIRHAVTDAVLLSKVITVTNSTTITASLSATDTAFPDLVSRDEFGPHPYEVRLVSGSTEDALPSGIVFIYKDLS